MMPRYILYLSTISVHARVEKAYYRFVGVTKLLRNCAMLFLYLGFHNIA